MGSKEGIRKEKRAGLEPLGKSPMMKEGSRLGDGPSKKEPRDKPDEKGRLSEKKKGE